MGPSPDPAGPFVDLGAPGFASSGPDSNLAAPSVAPAGPVFDPRRKCGTGRRPVRAVSKLAASATEATELVRLALLAMEGMLVELTDRERTDLPRPSVRFPEAARSLARAAIEAPDLAERAAFDAAAVTEDLDNVAALAPLMEQLAILVRRTDDSRLRWLAEAYVPSLALHGLAKAGARVDGSLEALVEPMGGIFAARRKRATKDEPVA